MEILNNIFIFIGMSTIAISFMLKKEPSNKIILLGIVTTWLLILQ